MAFIPYGRQDINQNDIDAVLAALNSDFLTQGPVVPQFEHTISEYCGVSHGIAVNSATSALHIACLALGLGPGDWLWTSPITFPASANCGLYCGANVDFVDIDPQTYNMSISALKAKLEYAKNKGLLPKIVVPVHLCGQSCDMAAIRALADQYGFKVIEDASHCIGGKYKDQFIGSCKYSDITVFSFHPVKIITTTEGGICLTNREDLAGKLNLLRSHGITRDPSQMTHLPDGPWYYQQVTLGYNYRMTELQAALGISQMARLDQFIKRRHELVARYNKLLKNLPITLPWQHPDSYSAFHLYPIRLNLNEIKKTHLDVFQSLQKQEIGVNLHYIPVYSHPFYQEMGFESRNFPEAEAYYQEAISLPLHHGLTDDQQDFVVDKLSEACRQ